MRRALPLLLALGLVAVAAAGCSDDGPKTEHGGTAQEEEQSTSSTSALPETSSTTTPMATTVSTTAVPITTATAAPGTTASVARPAPVAPADCTVTPGYPEPWAERPKYSGRIDIDPGLGSLTGTVSVRFFPDADTDRLVFRLWPNAPRIGRAGGRLDVTATSLAGQPIAATTEPGGAAAGKPGTILVFPGAFPAHQPVDAQVNFRVTIPGSINDRVARASGALRLGSVLPILSWVRGSGWQTSPAVDAFAEAAASEVADYDITVAAPAGYSTLATGQETEPGRFVGRAVRDWAATVARFRTGEATAVGGATRIVVGVSAGAAGDPTALANRVATAVDGLSAHFGNYPYPQLSVGITTGLTGGIEFPMHIFLGSGVPTIHLVHEVAHQWFYGVAGNDQYLDPWLDEGLATYAEARVDNRLAGQRARSVPRGHLGESMGYWDRQPARTYYLAVYIGGLQALGAVADSLGGYAALDCGLRRYFRDRAFSVSRPADLYAAITAQTGADPRPPLAPFGAS